MNITEKIFAAHCGRDRVSAGEIVDLNLDMVLANDVTAPIALNELKRMGADTVFDKDKICLVMDHFTPCATAAAAGQCKAVRDFAKGQGLPHFYDVGEMGIEHALLPEKGLILPGMTVIGGDSHTCTYGALGAFATGMGSTDIAAGMAMGELWFKVPESMLFLYDGKLPEYITGKDLILHTIGAIGVDGALYRTMEFSGQAIRDLSMDGRFTMCNMAIEAGAKNGIVEPDEKTEEYVWRHNRMGRPFAVYHSDRDTAYKDVFEFDVSRLEPQVAFPHLPENAKPVSAGSGIEIDQVVIGSCTNGRLEDLRMAARILRGRKVHPYVRVIIIPATAQIYREAAREGLIALFLEAGAAVSTPTCGPCFGGHMGLLGDGERTVATTNRNFIGRMGSPNAEIYLAGPYVAAASAVAGRIADPREVMN